MNLGDSYGYATQKDASRVFTDLLLNSPKHLPRFSPGYEGTENMFYFLNEIRIDVESWM